ncbi:lactosylceramide 4-alpha-galactosyltransferase-like [Palaemon carinicauda]|uniref:lactosylceramide 4-alpha-galactosyltransferase-like n=1 Tax=Palaemon carinicauda TaxID=392227 RepID=UPI0035B625D7
MRKLSGRRILLILCALVTATVALWILFLQPSGMYPQPDQSQQGPFVTLELKDPPSEGVILLEGYGGTWLSPRMLCSLESAARAHPDIPVTLLMTSPVVRETALLQALKTNFPNLQLLQLNVDLLFKGSILAFWYKERMWEKSRWPKSHFNDILRWLILRKYGGIYLDLDVVILRSLSSLPNCTGLESDKWVAAGVLKFSPEHSVIEGCIERIAEHFDGTVWGANGPELLTEVLHHTCDLQLPSGQTPTCKDVKVMPTRAFYPIPWWEWKRYVTEDEDLSHEILNDESVYALHVWNLHTQHAKVDLRSHQPYASAARIHCPITVNHSGAYM